MKGPRRILFVTAVVAALAAQPFAARADLLTITDMFVFGDSLSDGGNSGLLTQNLPDGPFPPPPYAGGRSSNGPTAVEQLWNLYNSDGGLQPSLAGGTNFAIGGATSGTENFNELNPLVPPDLQPVFAGRGATSQLGEFQAWDAANDFDPATSLFVIWLFPNDVFYASATGSLDPTVIGSAIANIASIIQILAAAGAQHFLVPNLANLADALAFAGNPLLNDLSIAFNTNLAAQLALLDAAIAAEITLFDTDALFQQVLADPGAYGLTNTTEPCVVIASGSPPTVCANPDEYLFWDGEHPTARMHEILAQGFRRALIAEPGTLVLLGLGLLVIGLVHRRRRG